MASKDKDARVRDHKCGKRARRRHPPSEIDVFRHRHGLARQRQAGRVERLGHQRAGAREDQKPRRVLCVGKRVEQPCAVRRISDPT